MLLRPLFVLICALAIVGDAQAQFFRGRQGGGGGGGGCSSGSCGMPQAPSYGYASYPSYSYAQPTYGYAAAACACGPNCPCGVTCGPNGCYVAARPAPRPATPAEARVMPRLPQSPASATSTEFEEVAAIRAELSALDARLRRLESRR